MPEFTPSDTSLMKHALDLAARARGRTSPNPMVGAVIVKGDKIIGEGYHRGPGEDHAEVDAIKSATGDITGAHMYVTLEPCCHHGRTPPCVEALIRAKIARVTIPLLDPSDKVNGEGVRRLTEAGIQVDIGLCEKEAGQLNESFFVFHTAKRPFLISKWAMTLDGKIATSTGHSRWVTNEASRIYVHEIRSQVDAVMVGIGTVLLDNPLLNVRLPDYTGRQPRRIVVDGTLRIPTRAKLLEETVRGQCIIATTEAASPERVKQLRSQGHEVLVLAGKRGLLDVGELMHELNKLHVQSILCEGGASLNGSLFEAQVVDKVIAFIAPKIIGGGAAKSPIAGWGVPLMNKAVLLEDCTWQMFNGDACMEAYIGKRYRKLTAFRKPQADRQKAAKQVLLEEGPDTTEDGQGI